MSKAGTNKMTIQINAPKERVFEIMTDHRRYVNWTRAKSVYLQKEGSPNPNGLGAIRVFVMGLVKTREEVIGWKENESMTYRMLNQWPLKNYTSKMSVSEASDTDPKNPKTELLWESSWTNRLGLAWSFKIIQKALQDFAKGIKADAEQSP